MNKRQRKKAEKKADEAADAAWAASHPSVEGPFGLVQSETTVSSSFSARLPVSLEGHGWRKESESNGLTWLTPTHKTLRRWRREARERRAGS